MKDLVPGIQFLNGPDLADCSLGRDKIICINDHYSHDALSNLVAQADRPLLIIQSFFVDPCPVSGHTIIYLPLWLDVIRSMLMDCDVRFQPQVDTVQCFNFMIFKQRHWRLLALRAIEHLGLCTNHYISTVNNAACHIPFTTRSIQTQSSWSTRTRWFDTPRNEIYNYFDHYRNFLKHEVFDPTAVALITETIESEWQDRITFTEKTLYSVLSCNIPIWLGGRDQHRAWQHLGFDSFEDVINCEYQSHQDAFERLFLALEHNWRWLTDLDFVAEQRHILTPRLLANRQRFIEHGFQDFMLAQVARVPGEYQDNLYQFLEIWRQRRDIRYR